LIIYFVYAILFVERRRGWLSERRRDVVQNRSIWISPVPIQDVNVMAKRVSAMWSPMEPIEREALAKPDSFCAERVAKPSPAGVELPSSTFERLRRKFLWDSNCWPKVKTISELPENVKDSLRKLVYWTERFLDYSIVNPYAPNGEWADSPETVAILKKTGIIRGEGNDLDGSSWLKDREIGEIVGEFVYGAEKNPFRGNVLLLPRGWE
jgi:hypothetical protein